MNSLANSTLLSRLMVDVHNDKGGVGKTTFTNVLKAFFDSFGIPVQIFRIDSSFSTATRPEDVLIPAESFVESGDLVGGVTALYEKVWDAIAEGAGVTIIDWGAGLTGVRNTIYRNSSLSGLIEAAGVNAISCVITDATAPVMRQAAQAMDMDREIVPAMRRALVCNGMRGPFQFEPHCEEAKVFQSELVPKLRDALRINFPQIPANAWQPFAAAGLSFEDALGRDVGVLSKATGQSIYRTTACRNALSAWWMNLQPELARFLPPLPSTTA